MTQLVRIEVGCRSWLSSDKPRAISSIAQISSGVEEA